jgi:hypothetical protein
VPMLTSGIPSFEELIGQQFTANFDNPVELCAKIEWLCKQDRKWLESVYAAHLEICCGSQYQNGIMRTLEGSK